MTIISHDWLQKYFPKQTLLAPDMLADLLTMRFAEIEGVKSGQGIPTTYDMKITPDRGCYGLCHAGVAYEIAALTGASVEAKYLQSAFQITRANLADLTEKKLITVDYDGCHICHVAEVELGTPNSEDTTLKEIQTFLGHVGQRSISPLVDILNFITFDIGQPLHAFDADKVKGTLHVRLARAGESLTTLDGTALTLTQDDAVTADGEQSLDLIGVKGGLAAETTANTKRVYLKVALYDKARVRRSSNRHGLRTDAAKRFEQGIDVLRSEMGLRYALSLIAEIYPDSKVTGYEKYEGQQAKHTRYEISLKSDMVSSYLGQAVAADDVSSALVKLGCEVTPVSEGVMNVIPPVFRLDLRNDRDLIEEIARLRGMENIPSKQLSALTAGEANDRLFSFVELLRQALVRSGAVEVLTYSLHEEGDLEILNPVSPERSHARTSIALKLEQALRVYGPEAVTVGYDDVTVFEIGSVFPAEDGEQVHLCIGVRAYKYKEKFVKTLLDAAKQAVEQVSADLNMSVQLSDMVVSEIIKDGVGIVEINLNEIASKLTDVKLPVTAASQNTISEFVVPSQFPSVVRDIAFFAPAGISEEQLTDLIVSSASDLLINVWAFDHFAKEGENTVSFGFRLVFQSNERTLTDAEVQKDVDAVLAALTKEGHTPRV